MGSPTQGLFSRADLGYYVVGDRTFFHKYEAFEYAAETSRRPRFHWLDEFWSAINWSLEPKQDLEDLYRIRAEQVREYDYIILLLSGGADSWNILRVFDKNNIHIDEIATYHDYSITNSWGSAVSAEPFRVAKPAAEAYIAKHPETIFSFIDIRESLFDALNNLDADQLLREYYGGVMSISMPARAYRWIYMEPRYRKLIESGKKVCLLKGWDKAMPAWVAKEGRYSYWFNDHFTAETRKLAFHPELPIEEEMFYWTPRLPELLLKGLHVVKNKMETLPPSYKDPIKINMRSPRRTYTITRSGARVSIPTVNTWLYPGWDINTFTVGKDGGGDDFISEKDFWVKDRLEEEPVKKWRKAFGYGFNLYKKLWVPYRLGPFNQRSTCLLTKMYYL